MPWHQEPKKDVVSCEKLRRAANKLRPVGIRMGKPALEDPKHLTMNKIVVKKGTGGTETSKYPEEKKEKSIFKVAASEMERARW